MNNGPEGAGSRICRSCGYGEPRPASRGNGTPSTSHDNPRTGKPCDGRLSWFDLGHSFLTDVAEFAIRFPDVHITRSLLYALLEGAAQALDIRRADLDGTLYRSGGNKQPSIVLFDDVPGGAGHARRIADDAHSVFKQALDIVSRNCCGPETSCYECLRTYRNQHFHDELSRGEARKALEAILHSADVGASPMDRFDIRETDYEHYWAVRMAEEAAQRLLNQFDLTSSQVHGLEMALHALERSPECTKGIDVRYGLSLKHRNGGVSILSFEISEREMAICEDGVVVGPHGSDTVSSTKWRVSDHHEWIYPTNYVMALEDILLEFLNMGAEPFIEHDISPQYSEE